MPPPPRPWFLRPKLGFWEGLADSGFRGPALKLDEEEEDKGEWDDDEDDEVNTWG